MIMLGKSFVKVVAEYFFFSFGGEEGLNK